MSLKGFFRFETISKIEIPLIREIENFQIVLKEGKKTTLSTAELHKTELHISGNFGGINSPSYNKLYL